MLYLQIKTTKCMQGNVFSLGGCKRSQNRQIPNAFWLKFPQNMIIINLAGYDDIHKPSKNLLERRKTNRNNTGSFKK